MLRKFSKEKLNSNKKLIAIAIICLLIGGFIGFQLGAYVTINAVADVASRFIDRDLVTTAIYQYRNNIGRCFPSGLENASLYIG